MSARKTASPTKSVVCYKPGCRCKDQHLKNRYNYIRCPNCHHYRHQINPAITGEGDS